MTVGSRRTLADADSWSRQLNSDVSREAVSVVAIAVVGQA